MKEESDGIGRERVDRVTYDQPQPIGRREAEAQMASGDPALIADAILRASLSEIDARWVEDACLRSLDHPELAVRWAALTALGHLVRRRRPIDMNAVLKAIEPLRSVSDVSGKVEDLLDDIEVYST